MDVSDRRIVLLGKTEAGKSSLANTIFGEDVFEISDALTAGTSECRAETRSINGRNITLIDTPGFFDTDRSEEELKSEIVMCITECAPGPHAFLIVLKVEKFTEQEQDVINKIQEYFSEEVLKYSTVVFTHGDQLPDEWTIESFVHQNKFVSDLVKKCGGRCHVVDNKYWNRNPNDEYRSNQFQVKELLNTIDKMVMENNGVFRGHSNKLEGIAKGAVFGGLIGALGVAVLPSVSLSIATFVVGAVIGGVTGYFKGADTPQDAAEAEKNEVPEDKLSQLKFKQI